MSLFNCDNFVFIKKNFQVQYETDETVVSGEERRGGPYKTATIIGWGRGCKIMQEFNHLPLCTDCLMNTCSFRSGMRRPLATRQHSGTEVRSVLLKLFSILNWLVFDVCWLQVQEQPVTSRKRWEHSIHSIKHRNIFHCYNTEISITV